MCGGRNKARRAVLNNEFEVVTPWVGGERRGVSVKVVVVQCSA